MRSRNKAGRVFLPLQYSRGDAAKNPKRRRERERESDREGSTN